MECLQQVLGLNLFQRRDDTVSGIADKVVQASEAVVNFLKDVLQVCGLGDRSPDVHRTPSGGDNLGRCLFAARTRMKRVHNDGRPQLGKPARNSASQSATRARDERDLALKRIVTWV